MCLIEGLSRGPVVWQSYRNSLCQYLSQELTSHDARETWSGVFNACGEDGSGERCDGNPLPAAASSGAQQGTSSDGKQEEKGTGAASRRAGQAAKAGGRGGSAGSEQRQTAKARTPSRACLRQGMSPVDKCRARAPRPMEKAARIVLINNFGMISITPFPPPLPLMT